MPALTHSVLWRSFSEGMYVFHDPDLLRGKKHVLIVLAPDRSHPAYEEALLVYEEALDQLEASDIAVRFEDHPGGLLHSKYECEPDAFRTYFFDKEGDLLATDTVVIPTDHIYALLGRKERQEYLTL